jgi:hypothetical protein
MEHKRIEYEAESRHKSRGRPSSWLSSVTLPRQNSVGANRACKVVKCQRSTCRVGVAVGFANPGALEKSQEAYR